MWLRSRRRKHRGNEAKMNADNSFYMRNAKYTMRQALINHTFIELSKAKVVEKDVVYGRHGW